MIHCIHDCAVAEFCPAENVTANRTTFIWLNTPAGINATFRCPNNPRHSVTRRCMACMRAAIWQDFDQQGCGVLSVQLEGVINSSVSVGQLLIDVMISVEPPANKTPEACLQVIPNLIEFVLIRMYTQK